MGDTAVTGQTAGGHPLDVPTRAARRETRAHGPRADCERPAAAEHGVDVQGTRRRGAAGDPLV